MVGCCNLLGNAQQKKPDLNKNENLASEEGDEKQNTYISPMYFYIIYSSIIGKASGSSIFF
jgi:hypothetical protein